MSLTEQEIKQLHENLRVVRESKILDKIPFKVASGTMKDELEIAKVYDGTTGAFVEEYFNSEINRKIVERCLVSFNNEKYVGFYDGDDLSKEEKKKKELELKKKAVDKFSNQKISLIAEEHKQLSEDIAKYLNGFEEKDLDVSEIEEFIITDSIERTSTFSDNLTVTFKILNSKEYNAAIKKVKELIDEKKGLSKMHKNVFQNIQMGQKVITSIKNKKLSSDFAYYTGCEIVRFILGRAQKLQEQIFETLQSPKKLGDGLKN